jgi:hypothetical protein
MQLTAKFLTHWPTSYVPTGVLSEPPNHLTLALIIKLKQSTNVIQHYVSYKSKCRLRLIRVSSTQHRHQI